MDVMEEVNAAQSTGMLKWGNQYHLQIPIVTYSQDIIWINPSDNPLTPLQSVSLTEQEKQNLTPM